MCAVVNRPFRPCSVIDIEKSISTVSTSQRIQNLSFLIIPFLYIISLLTNKRVRAIFCDSAVSGSALSQFKGTVQQLRGHAFANIIAKM